MNGDEISVFVKVNDVIYIIVFRCFHKAMSALKNTKNTNIDGKYI